MEPYLDGYRVFLVTAREGSFTKAAEALYITQPAVSHTIKQLEERLGGALFFRASRGVKLTAEGERLYAYIEQAFNIVTEAERHITEMHRLQSGIVRVGAGDTVCRHFLLPYLDAFHRQYPLIKLHVANRTSQETVKLLKEGKIDFGIVNMPWEDPHLDIRPCKTLHDIFVAGRKYERELGLDAVTPRQLADYPLILLEQGSRMRKYVDQYFHSNKVRAVPEFELGSMDLLLEFAKIGMGVACVTAEFAAEALHSDQLFALRLEPPVPPRHLGVVTLRDNPLSYAAKTMLSMLP